MVVDTAHVETSAIGLVESVALGGDGRGLGVALSSVEFGGGGNGGAGQSQGAGNNGAFHYDDIVGMS